MDTQDVVTEIVCHTTRMKKVRAQAKTPKPRKKSTPRTRAKVSEAHTPTHLYISVATAFVILIVVSSIGVYTFGAGVALRTFNMPRLAERLSSHDPAFYMELGDTFLTPESYNLFSARRAYARVLALDPKYPGANYQIGRTYFLVGDHALALMYLQEEERIQPSFGKVHYMKGLIYGFMKQFDDAGREFRAFIAYDSFNWAGYNDLAWIYFAQGYYEDAEATAREGLAQASGNPWLNNAVGVALLAQKRGAEAVPYFETALSGFKEMSPETWGGAYPGNSPQEHSRGLAESIHAVERNIVRAEGEN